jgi:uncharacterized tellurite resistance protein B-like protein
MTASVTDIVILIVAMAFVVGLLAPRIVLPRHRATRKAVALVYGALLAAILLYAGLGVRGLVISLVPGFVAWLLFRGEYSEPPEEPDCLAGPTAHQSEASVVPSSATTPDLPTLAPHPARVVAEPESSVRIAPLGGPPLVPEATKRLANAEPARMRARPTRWFAPGEPLMVEGLGLLIPDGMVYFGTALAAIRPWGGTEPALVNPQLEVSGAPGEAAPLGYWPSYTEISPAARVRYLEWLASGRRDPAIEIGYVFLFFYGLERRLLHDRLLFEDGAERSAVLDEVRALVDRYGANGSFSNYARNLLSLARLVSWTGDPTRRDEPPDDLLQEGANPPVDLRLRLGELAASGAPIPAGWALSWCLHDPNIPLRTPVRRCLPEFQRLFRIFYTRECGEGLIVKPNKTRVAYQYNPASASFGGPVEITREPVVPDITVLVGPVRKLSALVEQCATALEPYSRWIGRNPDSAGELAGAALLPDELIEAQDHAVVNKLAAWLEESMGGGVSATIRADELIDRWAAERPEALGKAACVGLCSVLDKLSFGLEPDVRFGGMTLRKGVPAVLFRIPSRGQSAPSPSYRGATVLLRLATMVAAADDVISPEERRLLETHLEEILQFSETERARLRAHLQWLLDSKPSMAGLKRQLEGMLPDHRRSLAEFLIATAGADGFISPEEIDLLRRIYPLLGLEPDDLFGHIHALASSAGGLARSASEPVVVRRAAPTTSGRRIPRPDEIAPKSIRGVEAIGLDQARIQSKLAETAIVAALLGSVFSENDLPPAPIPEPQVSNRGDGLIIPPLDGSHSSLLRLLGERMSWPRAEFEALAERHGVLPDGAIETINEAAFEKAGELVVDGDDPLELNRDVWKELVE